MQKMTKFATEGWECILMAGLETWTNSPSLLDNILFNCVKTLINLVKTMKGLTGSISSTLCSTTWCHESKCLIISNKQSPTYSCDLHSKCRNNQTVSLAIILFILHIRTPQFKIRVSQLEAVPPVVTAQLRLRVQNKSQSLGVPVERGEGVSLSVTSDCMLSKARSVSQE